MNDEKIKQFKERMAEGLKNMPSVTAEEAYAQARKILKSETTCGVQARHFYTIRNNKYHYRSCEEFEDIELYRELRNKQKRNFIKVGDYLITSYWSPSNEKREFAIHKVYRETNKLFVLTNDINLRGEQINKKTYTINGQIRSYVRHLNKEELKLYNLIEDYYMYPGFYDFNKFIDDSGTIYENSKDKKEFQLQFQKFFFEKVCKKMQAIQGKLTVLIREGNISS